jgi:hypothetical protein
MSLVRKYGTFWARNKDNMKEYRSFVRSKESGIYILYSGSAPVYIGKGHIKSRVTKRDRGGSKSPYWDHFSWFVVDSKEVEHELEALLLKALPFYLRSLNRQTAHFIKHGTKAKERNPQTHLELPKSLRAH